VWVNNCQWVLNTKLKNFTGVAQDGYGRLQWESETEANNVVFEIERSTDQSKFEKIGQVTGSAAGGGKLYQFNDPNPLALHTYYRIKVVEGNRSQYSKIVLLSSSALQYEIRSVINPFTQSLSFDMIAPEDGIALVTLMDSYGRPVRQYREAYNAGMTSIRLNNLSSLPVSSYSLRVEAGGQVFIRKVIKASY
jgi:hypothetical protein